MENHDTRSALQPCDISLCGECLSILQKDESKQSFQPRQLPSYLLKACVDQLTAVLNHIFNLPLLWHNVSTCFERTSIVHKKTMVNWLLLNDYYL